jgi:hypothetical protein
VKLQDLKKTKVQGSKINKKKKQKKGRRNVSTNGNWPTSYLKRSLLFHGKLDNFNFIMAGLDI